MPFATGRVEPTEERDPPSNMPSGWLHVGIVEGPPRAPFAMNFIWQTPTSV